MIRNSGKTVKETALSCGLPEQSLYTLISAKTDRISLSVLKKLSDHFGIRPEYFMDPAPDDPPVELSSDERVLIQSYRAFNSDGKQRVKEYVRDLGENPRYIRR